MKILYLGILFITSIFFVSSSKVKRLSGNDQRGDWSWSRNEQLTDAQTKSSSQANWPTKGSGGGSIKGKADMNPNRDGSWTADSWSSGENGNEGGFDAGWNTEPQGNNKGSAYPDGNEEHGGDLETILGGVPGMDFPNFVTVPKTDFDCSSVSSRGYYGDVEAGCQVFHICQPGNRKDSFLCPVGTIFNQKYFVCDWWYNVNCSDSPSHYDLNKEVYKDPVPVTEAEVLVTTEKTLPWSSQDLDKKRPPPSKSWGNQPSLPSGKQNPQKKNTQNRKGSKLPNSVATSREASNSWSQSDAQKEISVSWGSSSGTTSGGFGSSSTHANSFVPTTKPIWYGIDGQPAKDQSMSRRTGLVPTSTPFGTRMRKSTVMSPGNMWVSTDNFEPTTTPLRSNTFGTLTPLVWQKSSDSYSSATIRGWSNDEDIADSPNLRNGNKWNNGHSHTTSGWIKGEDIPETSINPSEVKGVWEQETKKKSNQNDHTDINVAGNKGFTTTPNQSIRNVRKFRAVSNQKKQWNLRQTARNTQNSKSSNRGWLNNKSENKGVLENSNINTIPRLKSWK